MVTNTDFSINNFLQNLKQHNETARTDKFDVMMTPPAFVANYAGISPATAARGFKLQCEISELPGRDIQMTEYTIHAFIQRVPHMNHFGAANFTFICTGDFWEKKFFDAWIDSMIPVATGLVNYPLDPNNQRQYETDIYINQYDMTGEAIYGATIIDAAPVSVGVLNQSWDNDSIHRLNVSFQFRKWQTAATALGNQNSPAATTFGQVNPGVLPNATSGIVSTSASAPDQYTQDLLRRLKAGI